MIFYDQVLVFENQRIDPTLSAKDFKRKIRVQQNFITAYFFDFEKSKRIREKKSTP
jgi:hypothetical protein